MPGGETPRGQLTPFLIRELLLDYEEGRLDSWRRAQVYEYLQGSRETQRELDHLQQGLLYTKGFCEGNLSSQYLTELIDRPTLLQRWFGDGLVRVWAKSWRAVPYVVLATVTVLGLVLLKPWQPKRDGQLTLTEQAHVAPSAPVEADVPGVMPAVVDSQVKKTLTDRESSRHVSNLAQESLTSREKQEGIEKLANREKLVEEKGKLASKEQLAAETKLRGAGKKPTEATPAMKGELRRGEVDVENFQESWPRVKAEIEELGGVAAGSVELGWVRSPGESYFHFAIPESKWNELESFLNTLGPVRFSRIPHPRVMPQGQIRIILTVKGATTDEGTTETP